MADDYSCRLASFVRVCCMSHRLEADGSRNRPPFEQGDCILFPSHKYHSVTTVTSGLRRTLIVEFWVGEERRCPHRCEQHWGQCDYCPGAWRRMSQQTAAAAQPASNRPAADTEPITTTWAEFNQAMRSDTPLSLLGADGDGGDHRRGATPRLAVAPAAPGLPQPDILAEGLDEMLRRYVLTADQIRDFRRDRYIRLRGVVPAPVLAAARAELISIVSGAMPGGTNVSDPDAATQAELQRHRRNQRATAASGGRQGGEEDSMVHGAEAERLWRGVSAGTVKPWHVQMGWTLRPCVQQLVRSWCMAGAWLMHG